MATPHTAAATSALPGARCWDPAAAELLDPARRGTVRVLGGAGTGTSSLLVDVATARIAAGTDPESVLFLTGSGRISRRTRSALTTALLTAGRLGPGRAAVRQPLVRSVHAYAFGVLRAAAQRVGDPPPRLITSAEQDGVIRELLAGDLEDGAAYWPPELHAALGTAGFATELRDLLARCTERGIDPLRLQRLGRSARRPEWTAAGRFAQQYEQVMLLRSAVGTAAPQASVPALGAAELVGAALEAFGSDPELLAAERARIRVLLVDDAQHLDPQTARLVRMLVAGTDLAVITGDPNQAAFGFRGADPGLLLAEDWPAVTLRDSHRCSESVAAVLTGLAAALPGVGPARQVRGARTESGIVTATLVASEHAEATLIADTLRRAHLIEGVPWSQMAVLVRSVSGIGAALPRILRTAGVPVAAPAAHPPLAHNAMVRALLTVLEATVAGLTAERAHALLTGPIGRVDPVSLRQLRRALRRQSTGTADFGELLVAALRHGIPEALVPAHARPLRRIKAVLDAAAGGHRADADPRSVLWQAWSRTGLQRRLDAAIDRGGDSARRADADLDAVTALFDVADQYVTRTAGATVAGLAEHVWGLQLPTPATEPAVAAEAVAILSPHQALDRDWDTVVVAGLQEGLWPNTVPRGGVLGTQRLLDVLAGIGDDASDRAPLIADERRLLITAVGRARRRLAVTAVDGAAADTDDGLRVPSPFFFDIARFATADDVADRAVPAVTAPPVLSVPSVVGRLRAVVCAADGSVTDEQRDCAATQLARLARAGVPGADPAGWQQLTPVSTAEPLWRIEAGAERTPVAMSPSTLQQVQDCPLRWLMERHGGADARELRSALGSVVHALIAEPGVDEAAMLARLERIWDRLPFESQWYARNELDRHRAMIETFARWREDSRAELTEVGTEVEVDGVLPAPDPALPDVRVRGRVDRLERDAEDRLVIVDIKTGKSPVSKDDAQQHPQLAAYQLAVTEGLVPDGTEPGGGKLVYLGKAGASGATQREQDPLSAQARQDWREEVHTAAAQTAGPQFRARINSGCAHCPVRPSCPAHRRNEESR
ncbi:ATP-dependent DNA helicase [[Mycobacterium] wendilense]|uniref:DNA 3'-5' helicase n=1 Tax=[Mycobacterium] wendilense TaxID=3064284 RepID=A0ABM9MGK9_9MYCO|nr:ATP-dependent DNA helicase [Mycolicibacterium sp. MU0050]CAJ1584695.1 ATP-dependent DNA helicase [Mycolicibacterium sp. MU0050]